MQPITITIENGITRFLLNEDTKVFLEDNAVTRRASHVEPVNVLLRLCFHWLRYLFGEYGFMASFTRIWFCKWRVNLAPIHGPILPGTWYRRHEAIEAEVNWLNQNFI